MSAECSHFGTYEAIPKEEHPVTYVRLSYRDYDRLLARSPNSSPTSSSPPSLKISHLKHSF